MNVSMKDRVAVITGGSKGIGLACARRFARIRPRSRSWRGARRAGGGAKVWPGMKQRKWGRIINVLNTFAKAPAAASAPTSVSRAAAWR